MKIVTKLTVGISALLIAQGVFAATSRWSDQCGPRAFNNVVASIGTKTTGVLQTIGEEAQVTFSIPVPSTCTEQDVCVISNIQVDSNNIDAKLWTANNNAYSTAPGFHELTTPVYVYTTRSQDKGPSQCVIVQVQDKASSGKSVSIDVSNIVNTGKSRQEVDGNWG